MRRRWTGDPLNWPATSSVRQVSRTVGAWSANPNTHTARPARALMMLSDAAKDGTCSWSWTAQIIAFHVVM